MSNDGFYNVILIWKSHYENFISVNSTNYEIEFNLSEFKNVMI
jgi:hypothetical protein